MIYLQADQVDNDLLSCVTFVLEKPEIAVHRSSRKPGLINAAPQSPRSPCLFRLVPFPSLSGNAAIVLGRDMRRRQPVPPALRRDDQDNFCRDDHA